MIQEKSLFLRRSLNKLMFVAENICVCFVCVILCLIIFVLVDTYVPK